MERWVFRLQSGSEVGVSKYFESFDIMVLIILEIINNSLS